jgi:SH3-like domain-containing protein
MTNKHYNIIAIVLLFFILLSPIVSSAEIVTFEEGTVISDKINMRLRPSLDAPIVFTIDEGSRIGIYCEYDNDWIRVIYGNYRGYIKRDLVFLPSEDSYQGNVLDDALRVRKNPGNYSTIVAQLEVGTPLTIKDIYGDWFFVSVNEQDIDGYVHQDFIEKSDSEIVGFRLLPGMSGSAVYNMQKELKKRNFYGFPCTGVYGPATKTAVRNFQRVAGLRKNGEATEETLYLLYNDDTIRLEGSAAAGSGGIVLKSDWYSVIDDKFEYESTAKIIDAKTGKSFNVTRNAGVNHADITPNTSSDTAKMKEIYGGSWSWERRGVWVVINGVMYAASMNGMPHGEDYNRKDNMDGQICLHFAGSKGHASNAVDASHQDKIDYAYRKARG